MSAAKSPAVTTTDPVVEPVLPSPSPLDALFEAWIQQWFYGLGLDVTLQNRIRAAADDLKTRLAGKE